MNFGKMDVISEELNYMKRTGETFQKEDYVNSDVIIEKSLLNDNTNENLVHMISKTMHSISSHPDLRLSICRINPVLLNTYIEEQDNLLPMDLRYQLLLIELDELKRFRKWRQKDNYVFNESMANLLPLCDSIRQSSHRCMGPRSKTLHLKHRRKERLNTNKFCSANNFHSPKASNSQIKNENYSVPSLNQESENIKNEEYPEKVMPEIKVETMIDNKAEILTKSPNVGDNLEDNVVSDNVKDGGLRRRRRGRPRKKKPSNYDESLGNLCCEVCSFIGISMEAVKNHQKEVHGDLNSTSRAEILPSVVKSEGEDEDWHDLAYDTFLDIPDETLFLAHPSPAKRRKKFACNHCSYKTDSDLLLDSHKNIKHGAKPAAMDLLNCSYCDQEVERKRLDQHMYTRHKDIKMHICDQCPFKTNSLINLTRHIDNMHLAINTHPCPECPLQCGSPHALRKHIDRIHKNIQNYMCELCSYRTSTGSELRTHMEMKHTATDRFRCDKCEFATALKRNLERHHVRVHSHIKPYSCPMQGCGYQATEKGDIDKHVRRVHMGMRRYQCHLANCEFKIDSKSKWLEHLAMEHRLSQQEIDDISLKRKRTRIGGAHRKAALLQSAPVTTISSPGFSNTPILSNNVPTSSD